MVGNSKPTKGLTEDSIAQRERELFDKIGKDGKRLSADVKLCLRMLVCAAGYVERMRAQGKPVTFKSVERELARELRASK